MGRAGQLARSAVILAAVLGLAALGTWHGQAWRWACHALGFDYGAAYGTFVPYDFWSGFGSDVGEVVIIGGLISVVRRWNCEVHGCWRLGRHQTAAGHRVCRVHHPDDHLTAERVAADHEAARG